MAKDRRRFAGSPDDSMALTPTRTCICALAVPHARYALPVYSKRASGALEYADSTERPS